MLELKSMQPNVFNWHLLMRTIFWAEDLVSQIVGWHTGRLGSQIPTIKRHHPAYLPNPSIGYRLPTPSFVYKLNVRRKFSIRGIDDRERLWGSEH